MSDTKISYGERVSRLVSWGHWFAFFNIIAAMLIGMRYISLSPWPHSFLGQAYLFISWMGHFSFLVFALYILILFPLTFVIPSRKILRLLAITFSTVGLTLLLLDSQAYKEVHLHLNPVFWELLLSKEKTATNSQWQYIFIALPVLFLIQLALSEWIWKRQRQLSHKKIAKPVTAFFFICFVCSHLVYMWADASLYNPITAQRTNFPLSYPMTAKSFMEKYGLLDRDEYQEHLEENGGTDIVNYPLEPMTFNGNGKDYNLLVIMVDNLRSDMLAEHTMPTVFHYAQNNQNFINHYSASNNTYGVFSLFYGLPSSYASSVEIQDTSPILLDELKERGYAMSAFSGDKFEDANFYHEVFEAYDVSGSENKEITSDKVAIHEWQSWLEKRSMQPWFSYLELTQVENFEESSTILPRFKVKKSSTKELLKSSYQSASYQSDADIAKILEYVNARPDADRTVVVITSNHGTEFNDNNNNTWGSNSNFSRYQLQIPMVIHWPNKVAKLYTHKTSHLDFSATIMQNLLNTTSEATDYSSGRNLFNSKQRPWILAADDDHIALLTDESTIVVDQYGNYKVYDSDYKRNRQIKPKLSVVLQGLSELKRFYH